MTQEQQQPRPNREGRGPGGPREGRPPREGGGERGERGETRKNDNRGYERFKDLFEAIVAYNE
jgi:hypothetical protein